MRNAIIFICYSHEDHEWRKLIVEHLALLEITEEEGLKAWSDTDIVAGEQWPQKIEDALKQACVAILLVSRSFFSSEFIKNKEIPALLQRYSEGKGDLKIIPIIASDCAWKLKPWLKNMEVRPKDGHGLFQREEAERDTEVTNIVMEIAKMLGTDSEVQPKTPDQASRGVEEENHKLKQAEPLTGQLRPMETESGGTTQPSSGPASSYQGRPIESSAGELPKRTQDDPEFRSAQLSEGKGDA
jgi:hypothetical protein